MGNNAHITLDVEFDDNRLLSLLFGERDQHLLKIENSLGVLIKARGNQLIVTGESGSVVAAQNVLNRLYDRLKKGLVVSIAEVDAALRMILASSVNVSSQVQESFEVIIPTRRRVISPRTPGQTNYIHALQKNDLVFAIGPAGTGKTYLAMATAVSALLSGQIQRIILSRPAVEAGERLGFLPGDLKEKVDPYLRPLYDALYDMLPSEQVNKRLVSGEIEIAPLAFMRGRTLSKAYIILDEAQNTTISQMKMFLTRMGEDSRMVITGDLSQIDLPPGNISGLKDSIEKLNNIEGIAINYFNENDVVRHPLVSKIVRAYDK
ncbi:MAG: PhoH family protein [Candidatus Paracaedimonas acanthamoebae]|uniref:PhoH-like protein n=1 Tax=Candidatus Paracaedimonas acanthamoebae TaxID=244581 RepID=A0A8J7PXQ9_9PROT|nr:PhoH family protein [Candidatus Paracaedimonas acanthamoebae]